MADKINVPMVSSVARICSEYIRNINDDSFLFPKTSVYKRGLVLETRFSLILTTA